MAVECGVPSGLVSDEPYNHRRPLVSIVIPYYSHWDYLKETVTSSREQKYPNVEIIVIDDGSPVPADSILGPSMDLLILRTENRGVAAARNYGFTRSSGEYLIFLDSDDHLMPGAVEAHVLALQQNPNAGMAFGSARIIDEHGMETKPANICRPRKNYFLMLLESNPIACPGCTMIRRKAFIDAGFFDESFRNAEDYHLYLRLARQWPIIRHAQCVAEYRKHAGGKSQNKQKMIGAVMAALRQLDDTRLLTRYELRRLSYGRRRWLHEFRPQGTMVYRLRGLYYRFRAMLTVDFLYYLRLR